MAPGAEARGRLVGLAVMGAATLAAPACDTSTEEGARSLYELERLTFVPAAPYQLEGYGGELARCDVERSILVDCFEVTRRDYLHYFPSARADEGVESLFSSDLVGYEPGKLEWPAFLRHGRAGELAERRGMRLLTAKEWIHVAVGRRNYTAPWGSTGFQDSWANTAQLGLGSPSPVGTFENGRSEPFGCYDLLGNVWEWVADRVPGYSDISLVGASDEPPGELDDRVSVMGGAYNTPSHPTFGRPIAGRGPLAFHAQTVDADTLSPAIGVRLCADAERYLWNRAARWGEGAEVRERLERVGARWAQVSGRENVRPLLEELAARDGAPESLLWLADGAAGRF